MANEVPVPPTTSPTALSIDSQTPAAPRTDQITATATTVTMPRAMESRNAVFITDHGSMWLSRRRALRTLRPACPGVGAEDGVEEAALLATAIAAAKRSAALGLLSPVSSRTTGDDCA